jgi:HlyD family type I secretion membrane fusion protein
MQNVEVLKAPPVLTDWRAVIRQGFILVFITFGVFGTWSAFAKIDGGVVAPGAIAVESNRKTLQHLEGGIVEELLVRDGTDVKEGDILLRLESTRTLAASETYRKQEAALLVHEARLRAQSSSESVIILPPEVVAQQGDPLVAAAIREHQQQFATRRESLARAHDVMDTQIRQTEKETDQARDDERSARLRLTSIDRELPGLQSLLARGLIPLPRVTALERERAVAQNAIDKSVNDFNKNKDRLAEIQARRTQLEQEYRQEAATALPDIRRSLNDIVQQVIVAKDAMKRIDVRAPVSGTVQQLRIFTKGGVIKPGDPILDIVPSTSELVVRARVATIDIDRVRPDLPVEIRLPQFQRFQSEVIRGSVRTVSRDTLIDEASRQPYFALEVIVERATVPDYINERLVAGMTADIIILTSKRTVLGYLVAPFMNSMALGLRER